MKGYFLLCLHLASLEDGAAVLQAVTQGPRFLPSCASVIFCIPRVCPCPCIFPTWQQTGRGSGVSPGPASGKCHSALSPLARLPAVPCAARGTEPHLLPGLPQEHVVSTPLRLSGPPLGGFWGQDLSTSRGSGESSPWSPQVIPKVSEEQAGAAVPVTVASRFKFWCQTWDERKALI